MLNIYEDFIQQISCDDKKIKIYKTLGIDGESFNVKIKNLNRNFKINIKIIEARVEEVNGYYKYRICVDFNYFSNLDFLCIGILSPNETKYIFIMLNIYDLNDLMESDYYGMGIILFTDDFNYIINKTKIGYMPINYRLKTVNFIIGGFIN